MAAIEHGTKVGIKAAASYLPPDGLQNKDRMAEFGIDEAFLTDKIGVDRVTRIGEGQKTSDMCVEAFRNLEASAGTKPEDVEFICVVTQNPDGAGLPQTAAIVQHKLGLPTSCAAFDISLGCSGFVYALDIAIAFMETKGLSQGIIFTADPYSKIIDPSDKNTVLLFGDAAAATLIGVLDDGPGWRPVRSRFYTEGAGAGALENRAGTLHMDGRAVFNFAAREVTREISGLLETVELGFEDIDYFLFHQGSQYILDTIAKRLALNTGRMLVRLADQGNTVSSSIPLLIESRPEILNADRGLLCGFGVGLSIATSIVERAPS